MVWYMFWPKINLIFEQVYWTESGILNYGYLGVTENRLNHDLYWFSNACNKIKIFTSVICYRFYCTAFRGATAYAVMLRCIGFIWCFIRCVSIVGWVFMPQSFIFRLSTASLRRSAALFETQEWLHAGSNNKKTFDFSSVGLKNSTSFYVKEPFYVWYWVERGKATLSWRFILTASCHWQWLIERTTSITSCLTVVSREDAIHSI